MTDITREQVERAIEAAADCDARAITIALGGPGWYGREDVPRDVLMGWREIGYRSLRVALTRWRDELAAADAPRKQPTQEHT